MILNLKDKNYFVFFYKIIRVGYNFLFLSQYEGAANEGGKGQSNWDFYTHKHPGFSLAILLSCFNKINFIYKNIFVNINY